MSKIKIKDYQLKALITAMEYRVSNLRSCLANNTEVEIEESQLIKAYEYILKHGVKVSIATELPKAGKEGKAGKVKKYKINKDHADFYRVVRALHIHVCVNAKYPAQVLGNTTISKLRNLTNANRWLAYEDAILSMKFEKVDRYFVCGDFRITGYDCMGLQ